MFSRICWKNVNAGKTVFCAFFIVKYNRNIKLIFRKDFLKTYQILFMNFSNVIYYLYNEVSISYYGLYKCFTLLKGRLQSLNSCWVVNARCDLWKVGPGWSNGGASWSCGGQGPWVRVDPVRCRSSHRVMLWSSDLYKRALVCHPVTAFLLTVLVSRLLWSFVL